MVTFVKLELEESEVVLLLWRGSSHTYVCLSHQLTKVEKRRWTSPDVSNTLSVKSW